MGIYFNIENEIETVELKILVSSKSNYYLNDAFNELLKSGDFEESPFGTVVTFHDLIKIRTIALQRIEKDIANKDSLNGDLVRDVIELLRDVKKKASSDRYIISWS